MKTIFKFLIVILFVSCSNNDDSKEVTQTCLTEDLGITADYKNPYPEYEDNAGYVDWSWTMLNDSILRIKTFFPSPPAGNQNEYYYFLLDNENKCVTFKIAKFRGSSDVEIGDGSDDGVIYPESSDYTLALQYWEENDKFIGKLTPNDPNPIFEFNKRSFWVELNDENHEPQSEWEEYLGL